MDKKNNTKIKNIKQEKLRVAVTTEFGLEKTAIKEIKEIIGIKTKVEELDRTILIFEIENNKKLIEKLFLFTIKSQSATKILFLIDNFVFNDKKDLPKKIKTSVTKKEFDYWFNDPISFYVRCKHNNNKDIVIDSREIEPLAGEIILNKNNKLKVSMENADLKVLLYIYDKTAFFGVDMTNNDLSKREYKLINSGKSVNATVAYHMIRELDYKQGEIFLDPNSKTAEIIIEAALYISGMHNYYKKMFEYTKLKPFQIINTEKIIQEQREKAKKNIKKIKKKIFAYSELLRDMQSGKSNAKVAGVLEIIEFSKISFDWLDTKFDKQEIDKIATILPSSSKHVSAKQVEKIYKELLYQIEFILKDKGVAGLLIQKPESLLKILNEKHKSLKLQSSEKIVIGELEYNYLIIEKTSLSQHA